MGHGFKFGSLFVIVLPGFGSQSEELGLGTCSNEVSLLGGARLDFWLGCAPWTRHSRDFLERFQRAGGWHETWKIMRVDSCNSSWLSVSRKSDYVIESYCIWYLIVYEYFYFMHNVTIGHNRSQHLQRICAEAPLCWRILPLLWCPTWGGLGPRPGLHHQRGPAGGLHRCLPAARMSGCAGTSCPALQAGSHLGQRRIRRLAMGSSGWGQLHGWRVWKARPTADWLGAKAVPGPPVAGAGGRLWCGSAGQLYGGSCNEPVGCSWW